jgi:asparagine synthase (glutamine-hydrolysing)
MCGIYASVGFPPDPRHLDVVVHRGPDGRGWRQFDSNAGPVVLGHRRLSIIDLHARADQPMSCPQGRYWLTFNGEIYNFIELRAELERQGEMFHTTSDTEVLLRAYVIWGESMLDRLLGMFAFAIYDAKDQLLFAARDRFGMKPLYYYASMEGLAFASEIKQLVDLPGFSHRINLARTYDYLSVGWTDHTEETMFADARQLRGGQCVKIDLKQRLTAKLPVRRWYELSRRPGPSMSESEAAARFHTLFEDAVYLHLRSDVRVGSCLSGGLDSSSIVTVMDRILKRVGAAEPIYTVSACYEDKRVDERPFIEMVVAATRSEPYFIYPSAERVFSDAVKMTWHQDEPHYSTSMYAQWCVFEAAKQRGIKVMLDGQGADEQLAGYHHSSFALHGGSLMRRGRYAALARLLIQRKFWHNFPLKQQLSELHGRPRAPAVLRKLRSARPPTPGAGWLSNALVETGQCDGATYEGVISRDNIGEIDDLGRLCLADTVGASLPRLLRYEDRNSMAYSIEARLPFLDHRLVEFTIALWDQHKIVGGDTKRVLRRAMEGCLPEPVRLRRDKIGFATPEQSWFHGPLRPLIEAGVRDTLEIFPGLFDEAQVQAGLQAFVENGKPTPVNLWMLVNFGIWGKVFKMRS